MRFSEAFQSDLSDLMRWRRDVRRFRTDPVNEALVHQCLDTFLMAPSVGLSEPWRIVRVTSEQGRRAAITNFEKANATALAQYSGEKAVTYASLKLSGMQEAPEHFAIYCADDTEKGAGLGASTMPEMRRYSVVSGVTLMWLRARALGLGLGWVSILDADQLSQDLSIPKNWSLIGYFNLGWPLEMSDTPELERAGWETRRGHIPIVER